MAGKVREMEARVLFNPANRLIPDGLAETPGHPPGMPPIAPRGSLRSTGTVLTAPIVSAVSIPAGCTPVDETKPGVIDLIGLHAFWCGDREARRGRA